MKVRSTMYTRSQTPSNSTMEVTPRTPPQKIAQKKITQTFKDITSIPIAPNASSILHLYLSHNKITRLEGIQAFQSLVSLNLSYNQLSEVAELKKIVDKPKMKRINLKMNFFEFGYQDYAVGMFENLKQLDGVTIEGRKQISAMASNISDNFIAFFQTARFIQQDHSSQQKAINREWASQISQLIFIPNEESLNKKTRKSLINTCNKIFQVSYCSWREVQIPKEQNIFKARKLLLQEMIDQFLLKYSYRHDNLLESNLKKLKEKTGKNLYQCFMLLIKFQQNSFPERQIQIHSGYNYDLKVNQAKYIQKVNLKDLQEHPMESYVNLKQNIDFNLKPETKYTKILNYKPKKQDQQDFYYESFPIFVYEKSFLQILAQIILENVINLLKILQNWTFEQKCARNEKKKQHQIRSFNTLEKQSSLVSFGNVEYHENQQKYEINIDKYSIRQINLVYKVLRTLKNRVKNKDNVQKIV